MKNWLLVVLLPSYFCFNLSCFTSGDDKPILTSKKSLEASLWSVLSPLSKQMAGKGRVNEVPKFGDIQRVRQDFGSGEREETSYPLSDYLFWLRSGECLQREEGVPEYFCPTPDKSTGRWSCVNDMQLCDQMRDCPNGEDESPLQCLFYHVIQSHVTKLTQSLIWRAREEGY